MSRFFSRAGLIKMKLFLCWYISICTVAITVNGQNCPLISQLLLGSDSELSTNGLIPTAFSVSGDNQALPVVQLFNYTVVCEVSGDRINTVRGVSIVVEFDCNSVRPDLPECTEGVDRITKQFQFACSSTGDEWTTTIAGSSNFVVSATTQANLDTPLENTCGLCVDPQQINSADVVTHCIDCDPSCNRGLMRCFGPGPGDCCNFYQEGLCVADCGSGLVPNSQYNCDCPAPSNPTNGQVNSTEISAIGSIVGYTCNERADLDGAQERTCTSSGWNLPPPTCNISRCNNLSNPEGGRVRYTQGVTVGSVATYECDTGRVLEGNAQRTCQANGNWSGSEPTCALVVETDGTDPSTTVAATTDSARSTTTLSCGVLLVLILAVLCASV